MSENEKEGKKLGKLNAEIQRRLLVAEMKSAGFLIELIESKRHNLKQKSKIPSLISISLRLTDLKTHIVMLYFPFVLQKTESEEWKLTLSEIQKKMLIPLIEKMIEAYERIRLDLVNLLEKEDSTIKNFLQIKSEITDLESKLTELNLCVGQLSGFVLGKLAETFL